MAINPTCRIPTAQESFGKTLPQAYTFLDSGGKVSASLKVLSEVVEVNESTRGSIGVNSAINKSPFWTPQMVGFVIIGGVLISVAAYWLYTQSHSTYKLKAPNASSSRTYDYINEAKRFNANKQNKVGQGGSP